MSGRISRIILFVPDVALVAAFYERHFDLKRLEGGDADWVELSAGGCNLGLHRAHGVGGDKAHSPAKVVFEVEDVHAAKAEFSKEGLEFGKVWEGAGYAFADAVDPAGNPIQISSRGVSPPMPNSGR
jgi:catechol 2,3-dioxygenase-like lactoylglutathione lyase family enzyme